MAKAKSLIIGQKNAQSPSRYNGLDKANKKELLEPVTIRHKKGVL